MSTPAAATSLRFGRFELKLHERRLLVDGEPAVLGARAIDLLLALATQPGRLVSKGALMDAVWPGLVVEENNLAAQISQLRKLVGADVVATVPGRGYRFIAQLDAHATGAATIDPVAPPASTPAADALRTNLPAELPRLLGRADELGALNRLVETYRLVSVVGTGGMGKSLLVQHLLAARRGHYPHGVCWVELADIADAATVPGAIAAALGVETGRGEALAALVAAVAPLDLLLALDNAEDHLAEVAHLCQAVLDGAPRLRLIVTSQAPLGRPVEQVFRLEPLAVPAATPSLADAETYGAVALFVERARAVDARFALNEATREKVIEICRALDGVPLAIELAAARAQLLGLARLLSSMQDRLDVLSRNRNRAAPARQQTLRATLEWSHALLAPREQQVLRRLAVVAGSGSLALIEPMLADDGSGEFGRWDVLDALEVLIDRSLVSVLAPESDQDEPRYRLLESTRAYALECLDQAGERERLQRRHALAVAAMFEAAYADYFSARIGATAWQLRLGADLDNARDALQWARAANETTLEVVLSATLLRALPPTLHLERMALAEACERVIGADLPAALQERAWIELSCAWADTQKPRSRAAAARALELARGLADGQGDRFALYHALCRAAGAAAQSGDLAAARGPLAELHALEDPAWPPQRRLWGAEAAQVIARIGGDVGDALRRSRELLALDRARGGDGSIAFGNLIDAELAAGDARAAALSGAEFVQALQGTRHEYSLAYARLNLCAAWLALDEIAQARAVVQAAWPQALVFELEHYATAYLALLAALEGRAQDAARLLGYSAAIYSARVEARETNEAVAMARAEQIARQQLGDAEFGRAVAAGAALGEREIAVVAFADAASIRDSHGLH